MTSGAHEDGQLGEIFLKLGKQGSTLAGVMDAFSMAISISLQYGVPLETFISKFTNMQFEPAGMTDDPDVRMSKSIMDYVFRRLALDYMDFDTRSALGIHTAEERQRYLDTGSHQPISAGSTAAELIGQRRRRGRRRGRRVQGGRRRSLSGIRRSRWERSDPRNQTSRSRPQPRPTPQPSSSRSSPVPPSTRRSA